MVWLEERHKGDGSPEPVVPHSLQVSKALELAVCKQVHVVQGEPILVQQGLHSAQSSEQGGQAVVVVALEEEVSNAHIAALLEQLGGIGHGGFLVWYHGEGVGHCDHVHGAAGREHVEYRGDGHIVLNHSGNVLDAHSIDSVRQC